MDVKGTVRRDPIGQDTTYAFTGFPPLVGFNVVFSR